MKSAKLYLLETEKRQLKQNKIKINDLGSYAVDEIGVLLDSSRERAAEISALLVFQAIPSIGPKFARDLISLGYYTINDLFDKTGPDLLNELERKQGFWTDPCVEDQFWLAVHYANNPAGNKNWWDFTAARKAYRAKHGYPADRPLMAWHEVMPAVEL